MKIKIVKIVGQVYIYTIVKVTYDRFLNGNKEFIIAWLKWELIIATLENVINVKRKGLIGFLKRIKRKPAVDVSIDGGVIYYV